ncbi:MAG: TetR/AcrR family transcriptional regulator [Chloroflexota bacterium]|nr:TetR/AcrR family transcriptional regulator [Chloroflexota bacterium]
MRILDATIRVMAGGLAFLSIPAVAHEAGVSVPTIYRHFGSKGALIAAVYPHIVRHLGREDVVLPRSTDEFRGWARAMFARMDSVGDIARVAMASPAADETRRVTMPQRFARIRELADALAPNLTSVDRDRFARLLVILTSSSAQRMWRDPLGSPVDEAIDDLDWVVRAMIASASGHGR